MIIATLLALGLMCGIQAPLASSDKDLPQIKKDLPKQQEPSTLDYYLGYIDNCLTAARKRVKLMAVSSSSLMLNSTMDIAPSS